MMFSIIIPLFNKEKSILRTITSVLKQNYKNFELIIVNDGSTDKSLEVVNSIIDDRIKIINKSNGGVSSARNAGINSVSFEWICFLDADDFWIPNHLEVILELINKYPLGAMFSTLTMEKSKKGMNFIQNSLPEGFEGYIDNYFDYASKGTIFNSSCVCIKKFFLDNVGGFDVKLKHGEDLDVWFKIISKNRGVIKKIATVVYDLSAENRAMLSICKFENHLVSKIDRYRDVHIEYLNEFIDFFILRNSVPFFFSPEKELSLPNLLKIKSKNKLTFFWKLVYSDTFYNVNFLLYKFYKKGRTFKFSK